MGICFLKLKSLSNVALRLCTVSDGVLLWLRMFAEKKRVSAALSGCLYNEISFASIEAKSIVCHPVRDTTETVTQLFK